MSSKQHIECVDRYLRDIMKVDKPFGGITILFGGDPQQILPVVHHGDRARIVQACVKSSCLWRNVYELHLTQNMRLDPKEVEFSKYLLTIGEGCAQVFPNIGDQVIKVPEEFLVKSLEELVAKVFPNITAGYEDKYHYACRSRKWPTQWHSDDSGEASSSCH